MKIVINDIQSFKLLMAAMGKNDPRFYLNGILFDIPNLKAVGTDGRRMFVSSCIASSDIEQQATVLFAKFSVPSKTKSITVEDDEITCFDEPGAQGNRVKIVPCELTDADYPNYQKALNSIDAEEIKPVNSVMFNMKYIKEFSNAINSSMTRAVTIDFKKSSAGLQLKFSIPIESEYRAILMPMHLGPDEESEQEAA